MSRWLYLMLTLDDSNFHVPPNEYLEALKKIFNPRERPLFGFAVFLNRRWILSGYSTNHQKLDIFGKNLISVNYVCVAYLSG